MTDTGFDGMFPAHTEWWRRHLPDSATVVLRCGSGGCGDRVGEIKTDGETTLVLIHNRFPEAAIPVIGEAAPTEDELHRRIAARDAQTLRYTGDGRRVAPRHQSPAAVIPAELLSFIVCPTNGVLPVAKDTVNHLQRFVADTQRGSRREYLLFRAV